LAPLPSAQTISVVSRVSTSLSGRTLAGLMRPLRGLTWGGTIYFLAVILLGAAIVPISLVLFPLRSTHEVLALIYLGVLTQIAALMPIRWRQGSQTVDTLPLVAASLLAPGTGPALLSWLCKYDGRRPSQDLPAWKLLFNRAKTALEFAAPSMVLGIVPLPPDIAVAARTLGLAVATLLIGYPLTAKGLSIIEGQPFRSVLASNVGMNSIRSVLILCLGGGTLFIVLQFPGGYVMGIGLLGLLVAVRSNIADAQRQQEERIQTLELLAQALDARDAMTELHSQRVSNLAAHLAKVLGLSTLEIDRIRVAGLLHDIGKIGVPDAVLKKPSQLSATEWHAMRRHAEVGAEMIARHSALRPIAGWVRHHHERWNGSGYPAGLVASAIPMGARILAVADSFDTITGPRVYRPSSMDAAAAVADISAGAGTLYDPVVVNALRQLHDQSPLAVAGHGDGQRRATALELVRGSRDVRALVSGMTVSSLGDPLTTVAVTVSAFALTHNALVVAAAVALRALATMVSGALIGGAADRWPRRQLIATTDVIQAMLLLATPLLMVVSGWMLLVIVLILGGVGTLGQAARDAGVQFVVSKRDLTVANGVIATGTTVARAAGYPLAAAILWTVNSASALYVVDGLTFAIAAVVTLHGRNFGGGITARRLGGVVKRAFDVASLRGTLVIAGSAAFLMSLQIPVVIALAAQLSSNGPRTYTLLEIVLTSGMLVGALGLAGVGGRTTSVMIAGLLLMGVLSTAIAASSVLPVTAGLLFAASIGNQLYVIGNRTELQQLAPSDRVGSVMATRSVIVQTMAIAGSAAGGVISVAIGPRQTYGVVGIGLLALAVAVIWTRSRRWQRSPEHGDRGQEPAPAELLSVGSPTEAAESA
jgi:putative nucleotidyltransferase with HDIG domain